MKVRHRARIIALQALFEIDCIGHEPRKVLEERFSAATLPKEGHTLTQDLVWGVQGQTSKLDKVIQQLAPEWPIEQMAIIDRNILRMAIFEIATRGDVPIKVVINEAVELAKLFGSDSARRFVNGVLGTLITRIGNDDSKVTQLLDNLGVSQLSQQEPTDGEANLA